VEDEKENPRPVETVGGDRERSQIRSFPIPAIHRSLLEILFLLEAAFPACFSVYEARRRPLKVGIRRDLVAVLAASGTITIAEADLARALTHYTSAKGYLRELKAGWSRIDLGGNPAGVVTADEAERAAMRLSFIEEQKARQEGER